jgi:metal-responsive CopG/Arc/MetJ family transcriptional regulator
MKTAVSIPDDLFEEAERLARRSNISRSELYANALRELLVHDREITNTLDRVYADEPIDPAVVSAARQTFSRSQW